MTGRILIGFTGGGPSLDALALGGAIASATGASILALHVQEAEEPFSPYDAFDQATRRMDSREVHALLDRVAPDLAPGVRVGFDTYSANNPAAGLHEFTAAARTALIVTGSTHRNPVAAVLLGATGERLLEESPCPVAIASRGLHERAPLRLRRIGCGLDGSPECLTALRSAAELAREAGADLEALVVVPEGRVGRRRRRRSLERQAGEWLEQTLPEVGASDARATVLRGRPTKELVAAASTFDLLALGSGGGAPIRQAVTGSVSGALVRAAEVPLLVVPRGATPAPAPA